MESLEQLLQRDALTEQYIAHLSRWLFGQDEPTPRGVIGNRIATARRLFGSLFLQSPVSQVADSEERDRVFGRLIDEHLSREGKESSTIPSPYPKWELQWVFLVGFGSPLYLAGEAFFGWLFSMRHTRTTA